MIKQTVNTVYGGLTLVRHYDDTKGSADIQCGSIDNWNQWIQEMSIGLEYYNFNGHNKFFSKVKVNCFSLCIDFPNQSYAEAYCWDRGQSTSEIFIRFFADLNRFKGAISHEMGHAYHNWCECMYNTRFSAEFLPLWEKQISINGTTFNPDMKPWDDPWNCGNKNADENGLEQFANAFRCFFGTKSERGSSGAGTDDPTVPGFKDPNMNQAWCIQMKLLPETSAMVKSYGIKPGTLSWSYGDYGGFVFKTNELWPRWVCHWFDNSNYAVWYEWMGSKWVRFSPNYNRT